MKKWFIIGLIGSIIIWGSYQIFFAPDDDVTALQEEPQVPRVTQDIDTLIQQAILNYEKIKSNHDTIRTDHDLVDVEDAEVKNWIIHTHIQSAVIKNEDLKGVELVNRAMDYKHNNEAIIEWAKNEHGIEVKQSEIEGYIDTQIKYIENGKQAHPFFTKISEALDLTQKEYLYEWEYDRFTQNLVQDKLFNYYKENHQPLEDESLEEYEKRIILLMEEDLRQYDQK
ncbi:hypothetical protein [Piscibacillus salipiscarius]|uniref:Uncharacterized protein n=1 Tax=Piscibacillus salipiscarius TaxID=299480 RepID=A0ABW5Q7V1_9BACI|nr:hypothetical protein [Piscibacillus salipiscarius]